MQYCSKFHFFPQIPKISNAIIFKIDGKDLSSVKEIATVQETFV